MAYGTSGSGSTTTPTPTPTPSASADLVNSFTAPSSVSAGQTVAVSVNYSATTSRKIQVMLLNPNNNWSYHGGTTVDVPAGSGTINSTVTIDSSTPNGSTYSWQAQIVDTSYNWINSKTQDNVTVGTSVPTVDAISSFSAPSSVSAGQTVTLTVNYSATTSRIIQVMMLNPSNNWSWHGGTNVNVPAGSGTLNIDMTVDASTPPGSTYSWQTQIVDSSYKWLDGKTQNSVVVSASAPAMLVSG